MYLLLEINRKNIINGELEHTLFIWATICLVWEFLWCIAIIFFGREASPCTHKSFPCENISITKWKLSQNNRMVSELKVTVVLSALSSHWTAVVTALQQDQKKLVLPFSTVPRSCMLERPWRKITLVSALASSSSLWCREPLFFISNTCSSSKSSVAQFSNVSLLYAA